MTLTQNIERMHWEFANDFRCRGVVNHYYYRTIAAAYLVYTLKKSSKDLVGYETIIDLVKYISSNDERDFVYAMLNGVVTIEDMQRWIQFDLEALKTFIIFNKEDDEVSEAVTPHSISELVYRILEIDEGESVIDCCSGVASFLLSCAQSQPNASYVGVEINHYISVVASIKAKLAGYNIKIENENCLYYVNSGRKFDKAFSNHPFGMRIRMADNESHIRRNLMSYVPALMKATSADWLFTYSCLNMLNERGKAVAIMTLGSLSNTIDKPIREYFLKIRKIKAIITIPPKMFPNTAIPAALIVMDQMGSDSIRFIDASKLCTEGRRQNTFSAENIGRIVQAVFEDCDISRSVSIEEVFEENCSFNPSQYLEEKIEVKNGVPFGSLIKNITRGVSCTASELDKLASTTPTDCQYLMMANIQSGLIEKDLPFIKEIPAKMEKYCIKTGNIIMSKNGYPFKIAVADVPEGRKVLASGNLFIIEVDEDRVNPYYLKAFFESELGIASLKNIVVGATVPSIGLSTLTKLMIPMLPKYEQDIIADKYLAVMGEIKQLKEKIVKAESTLKTIFPLE
ncbi:MAG: N-6 DNA methylase [Ruminococcus sp.]